MLYIKSQKSISQSVLKSETLYIPRLNSKAIKAKDKFGDQVTFLNNYEKKTHFSCEALLCFKDEFALLNLRWYLTHILKVLHLCWFAKRNNKRLLFVDDNGMLIEQHMIIERFVAHQYDKKLTYPKTALCFSIGDYKSFHLKTTSSLEKRKHTIEDQLEKKQKFNMLFSLTQSSKENEFFNHDDFHLTKTINRSKKNTHIAFKKSRETCGFLLPCGMNFSNSHVAFKNHFNLLSCHLDSTFTVVSRLSWSKKAIMWQHLRSKQGVSNDVDFKKYTLKKQITPAHRILGILNQKQSIAHATSAWKWSTDLVFFMNPRKTPQLVSQVNRSGIPSIGLIDGDIRSLQKAKGFQSKLVVHYPILGNANSIYFVVAVLSKCLCVLKKKIRL